LQLDSGAEKVYLPKCLVILSTYPYLAAFREYLTQLNRLSKSGEMTLPIERYITNFCSEIPAPPPGSFEVQTTILDSVIRIWSPPHNLPIAWVSLPFANLFECLDVENIILVWHCLVLERQVLLTCTQLSVLTNASEILLSLLFPMRWSHAYIPVLPHFLIPILSAPMPFLCGIHKANLADALFDLSRDCVLVDLDRNTVTLGPDTAPLPPLPPLQEDNLRAELFENVGTVFLEARSLRKTDDYSENGIHLPPHTKAMAEAMWESKLCLFDEAFHLMFTPETSRKNMLNGNDASGLDASDSHDTIMRMRERQQGPTRKQSPWDAVQEAFLDTFVYLLRNYRKFLVFPSKDNEGSYGGAGFRSNDFIEQQRFDMREFLQQLIGTQMFDNFITKRLYGSGEADVSFFDSAVDRFLKSAGIFADVDIGGRISSGLKGEKPTSSGQRRPRRSPRSNTKKDGDPMLQSARVHRKLKTIVPPEPTGEGLESQGPTTIERVSSMTEETDDSSVTSSSTAESSKKKGAEASRMELERKAAEIVARQQQAKFTYAFFPSEFDADLFGTPRPLPPAVIAEFDRQRKDAAQFKRKNKGDTETPLQVQRISSAADNLPPSSEVATFTVFFMAFTALVGKELVEMASKSPEADRTILSTFVPPSSADQNADTNDEDDAQGSLDVSDEDRRDVSEMKSSRPNIGGMFDDDGGKNTEAPLENASRRVPTAVASEPSKEARKGDESGHNGVLEESASSVSSHTTDSKPKQRFRDKISDLEIEEAKATGRGQLGLAFEMLTMMKRRCLKADPEAYQCLIDACGRVGDTKRATELLSRMHDDGIVADGTVYACLVSAFSADSAWKKDAPDEDLPEWANSTAVEMDWNKLQKKTIFGPIVNHNADGNIDDDEFSDENATTYQKLRRRIMTFRNQDPNKAVKADDGRMEFFVTEPVERQIGLGENLLEIVFPDISVDTEDEVCPRCNCELSDDDVVEGWTPDSNEYTTACPNCTQRFVPHFCVQCSSSTFVGSRGPASPLVCERLSPWVLQKEIRSVMSDKRGIENISSPSWRESEYKNAVLWWNLVLSCMRYRFPFTFLLQGSFEQSLITPLPEDDQ